MPRTMSLGFPPFTFAVKWLLAINAGVFLLLTMLRLSAHDLGSQLLVALALVPADVVHGWIWQLVTYSFIHLGLFHVLFNMLSLWMFGSTFESDWGSRKFIEFYFFCVIGAALVTVGLSYTHALGLTPTTLTAGASGGIYGILMAFGLIYGDRELMLFPLPFLIKAKYFVAVLVFIAIYSAFAGDSGVANIAHLGGLLFGLIYVKFLPRKGLLLGASERYYGLKNSYYKAKRRRAGKKFQVYMRKHDRKVYFDEHGNYLGDEPPDEPPGKPRNSDADTNDKGPWVN